MSWIGLALFVVAIALMVTTGLPAYAVLLATASVGAALGIALGTFEWPILGALPARVVGLLEHDLLQALPLYALIGALLNRLPLAGLLHRAGERVFARSGAAAEMSALGVGALLAPMNGSVGASLHALSQRVAPALAASGVAPAEAAATVCVASTLGIVIPPSLVLLLLGDAMMRAHTEAANATHRAVQIVNTQDIVRAALLPGLLVFAAALAIAAWRGRSRAARALAPLGRGAALQAAAVALVIVLLLAAVASGRLYAVEAAATGAVGSARLGGRRAPPRRGRAARRARRRDGAHRRADGAARRRDQLLARAARLRHRRARRRRPGAARRPAARAARRRAARLRRSARSCSTPSR